MPLSSYGPGNDLLSTQITPGTSPRLQGLQDMTDGAASGVAGYDFGGAAKTNANDFNAFLRPQSVGFRSLATQNPQTSQGAQAPGGSSYSAPTGQVGAGAAPYNPGGSTQTYEQNFGSYLQPSSGQPSSGASSSPLSTLSADRDTAAANVMGGPSRSAIAQQRLQAFDTASAPQLRDAEENVAHNAGALGTLGMGRTSLEATRPYTDYLTQRSALATNLAADTATGEIGDRLNTLGATGAALGQEQGFQQAERNAELGAQQFNVGQDQNAKESALGAGLGLAGEAGNYGLSAAGTLGGLAGAAYGEDTNDQNALRAERDYQTGQEQTAYNRGVQGLTLQDALTNSAFGRAMGQYQAGQQNNPATTQLTLSQLFGNNAAQASSGLGAVAGAYGMRAGMGGAYGGGGYGQPATTGPLSGAVYDPRTQGRPTVPTADGGVGPTGDPFGPLGIDGMGAYGDPGAYDPNDPYGDLYNTY